MFYFLFRLEDVEFDNIVWIHEDAEPRIRHFDFKYFGYYNQ